MELRRMRGEWRPVSRHITPVPICYNIPHNQPRFFIQILGRLTLWLKFLAWAAPMPR